MNQDSIPLPPRGPECPAPATLEALSAQEPQRPEVLSHVARCAACEGYLSALASAQAAYLKRRPPEQFLAKLARRERAQKQRRRFWIPALGLVLSAALVVLVVVPFTSGDQAEGIRLKGEAFRVIALREGASTPEVVAEGERLREGDALRFGYRAERPGHLMVLDLDASGAASLFVPFEGTGSIPVTPGGDALLEGSVTLDDAVGAEWLFAVFSDRPLEAGPLLERLEAQRGAARPELSCEGCEVSVLRIQKTR